MTRVESRLLSRLAEARASVLVRRGVRRLQALREDSMLTSPEAGLVSIWDEVCVQMQGEESIYWDVYLLFIREGFEADVDEATQHERDAMWLQTPAGERWLDEVDCLEEEGAVVWEIPSLSGDITEWLTEALLYEASGWSNPRIRKYRMMEW